MHPSFKRNTFAFNTEKGLLYVVELASSTMEGKIHLPELPKELMPFFNADMPLV